MVTCTDYTGFYKFTNDSTDSTSTTTSTYGDAGIMTTTTINGCAFSYEEFVKSLDPERLLYKCWITLKEWIMILHITRIYQPLKGLIGEIRKIYYRKTINTTSPIIRNKAGGRA